MKSRFLAGVLACSLAGCGGGGSAAAPAPGPSVAALAGDLSNPVEVDATNGRASVDLTAAVDPRTGGPAFFFAGAEQAPTIRVHPGDAIAISLKNALPVGAASGPPNLMNLHFHGLTLSPNAPQDDSIDVMAQPGQTISYLLQIPPEQPPGLYWYHPHSHGESNWQVSNGMSGAIVVEGVEQYAPQVAAMRERVMIVRDSLIHADYTALEKTRKTLGMRRALEEGGGGATLGCGAPETNRALTVNGVQSPTIRIASGERQFWRIVNASAGRYLKLSLQGGGGMQVVETDGVPPAAYPGTTPAATANEVVVPPAGRSELVVTGSPGAVLHTACVDSGPDGDPDPDAILATTAAPIAGTYAVASRGIPSGLAASTTTRRTASASGDGVFGPIAPAATRRTLTFGEDANGFYLNGVAYDPAGPPAVIAKAGTVEEWTLVNATAEIHAFHMHQVHFVVESVNGVSPGPFAWTDTVNIPYQTTTNGAVMPGTVKVLIDFRDPLIRGTFLYHCHLLEHEDGGMMAKIAVQ